MCNGSKYMVPHPSRLYWISRNKSVKRFPTTLLPETSEYTWSVRVGSPTTARNATFKLVKRQFTLKQPNPRGPTTIRGDLIILRVAFGISQFNLTIVGYRSITEFHVQVVSQHILSLVVFFKPSHFFGHEMMNGKVGDEHRVAGSKHVLVPCDVTIVHHQILAVPDKGRTSLFSILRIRCAMEVQESIVHTLHHPMQKSFHEGHAIHNGIIMFQIVHSHIEATDRTSCGGHSVTRVAKHELIRRQQIKNVDPRVRQ